MPHLMPQLVQEAPLHEAPSHRHGKQTLVWKSRICVNKWNLAEDKYDKEKFGTGQNWEDMIGNNVAFVQTNLIRINMFIHSSPICFSGPAGTMVNEIEWRNIFTIN